MSFYSNLASTASKLLTTYGQQLTFTRTTMGDYSPATSDATTSATSFKGYGAVLGYKTAEIDGTAILNSDLKILLEKTKQAPRTNDRVSVDGSSYVLVGVKPTNPAGTPVVYECQARVGDSVSEFQ